MVAESVPSVALRAKAVLGQVPAAGTSVWVQHANSSLGTSEIPWHRLYLPFTYLSRISLFTWTKTRLRHALHVHRPPPVHTERWQHVRWWDEQKHTSHAWIPQLNSTSRRAGHYRCLWRWGSDTSKNISFASMILMLRNRRQSQRVKLTFSAPQLWCRSCTCLLK